LGNNVSSGGGERLVTTSPLTSAFKSGAIRITRHGVVIVPEIAAGLLSRSTSAFS
jgi:hypothetical protein